MADRLQCLVVIGPPAAWVLAGSGVEGIEVGPCFNPRTPDQERNGVVERVGGRAVAAAAAAMVGGDDDRCPALEGDIAVDQIEDVAQVVVDRPDRIVPHLASPATGVPGAVRIAVVDKIVAGGVAGQVAHHDRVQVRRVGRRSGLHVDIGVDLVGAVIGQDQISSAVVLIVTLVEDDELGLAGVHGGRQSVVMDHVEHAGHVIQVRVTAVMQGFIGSGIAVVGVAVVNGVGLAVRLEYRSGRGHADVIGDRDGVGVIGAGIEGRSAFVDQAPEGIEVTHRIVVHQVEQKIGAHAVHADKNYVVGVLGPGDWSE